MSARQLKRPPIVRLPPRSTMEIMFLRSAQAGMIVVGFVAFVYALEAGEFVLAPVVTAIVIGLMLGPVATMLERRGFPGGLSAAIVVLLFLLLVGAFVLAVATPLSTWASRIPEVWGELRLQLTQLREPLAALQDLREQLRQSFGANAMRVSVEEGSAVESVASLAPAIIGQVLLFLASLYFFVATRQQTRQSILRLCMDRRLRWRVAHIFRDVERSVSRYLLSIALINVGLGLAVGLTMFTIGMPSPALWGALAGLLNFAVYVGPAVMSIILLAVGLTEFDSLAGAMLPPAAYLFINMIEAQFVTPHVLGRTLTMNPFLVILALAFWIWMWGPLGGFIAIPLLLITYSVAGHLIPGLAEADDTRNPSAER